MSLAATDIRTVMSLDLELVDKALLTAAAWSSAMVNDVGAMFRIILMPLRAALSNDEDSKL